MRILSAAHFGFQLNPGSMNSEASTLSLTSEHMEGSAVMKIRVVCSRAWSESVLL